MKKDRCHNHVNGFKHFKVDLGGIEKEFDLGFKFDTLESDSFNIDPKTGVKSYAEPYIILYISFSPVASLLRDPKTLCYGLTRMKWEKATEVSPQDKAHLLEKAKPQIKDDLKMVQEGGNPNSLLRTEML